LTPTDGGGYDDGYSFWNAAIREQARTAGVALACLATSIRYADPAAQADMLAQTHARIDLAADVGAPALRVFGGPIPKGMTREQGIAQLVACLKAAADHAAERGVTLCLETHDDWCDPAHVAAVLEQVNHPAVACNWDVMHPVRMGKASVAQSFAALRRWIRHTHLHDGVGRETLTLKPIGTGDIDHQAFIRLLKTAGYTGFLSGEWIRWGPAEIHLPRELATLKGYERQAG